MIPSARDKQQDDKEIVTTYASRKNSSNIAAFDRPDRPVGHMPSVDC